MLILTQGLMFGLGASMSLTPSLVVPSHWFTTRLGLASGIAVAGSGIGGLIFSPFIQYLIDHVGVNNALRIIAVVIFVVNCFPSVVCKAKMTVAHRTSSKYNWRLLRSKEFLAMACIIFFNNMAFFAPFFLIPRIV